MLKDSVCKAGSRSCGELYMIKKLAIICTLTALCAVSALADNDKDKSKKVPPGLEKKGGLPPGIAKRQGQGDTAPATAPATTTSTPAAPATTPAPVTTTTKPVENAAEASTAKAPTTQTTPTTTAKKTATFAEQKAKLEAHTKAINDAAERPRVKAIAIQQIAKETGMQADRIELQEKNHPGIGTAALLFGNLIAKQSGAKFHDVVEKRMKGASWGDVAKSYNVELGPLIQKASDVAAVARAAQTASAK